MGRVITSPVHPEPVEGSTGYVDAIKAAIHDDIRPLIMQDGGDIEFVAFANGVVTIKFSGACVSCPFSMMTLKLGILERLSDKFPDVKDVIAL